MTTSASNNNQSQIKQNIHLQVSGYGGWKKVKEFSNIAEATEYVTQNYPERENDHGEVTPSGTVRRVFWSDGKFYQIIAGRPGWEPKLYY